MAYLPALSPIRRISSPHPSLSSGGERASAADPALDALLRVPALPRDEGRRAPAYPYGGLVVAAPLKMPKPAARKASIEAASRPGGGGDVTRSFQMESLSTRDRSRRRPRSMA